MALDPDAAESSAIEASSLSSKNTWSEQETFSGRAIVKYTFVEVEAAEDDDDRLSLRRSKSESELSSKYSSRHASSITEDDRDRPAGWKRWRTADQVPQPNASDSADGPKAECGPTGDTLLQSLLAKLGESGPVSNATREDIEDLDKEGLLEQIPKDEQGELTSIGSFKHEAGTCAPCLFWFNSVCSKELRCQYCHFRHEGQKKKRIRPSKKTRLQMRAEAENTITGCKSGNDCGSDDAVHVGESTVL